MAFWIMLCGMAPLLLLQGWRARRQALRLPPVLQNGDGARVGDRMRRIGLWVIGESPAVGVGVEQAGQGIVAMLADELRTDGASVDWIVHGENGATLDKLLHILDAMPAQASGSPDIAIILTGVNDTTSLTSIGRWRRGLGRIIEHARRSGARQIVFAAVAPMRYFTLLPQPLRFVLGWRAQHLDSEMRRVAERHDGVTVAADEFPRDPAMLAEDGYHPSAEACRLWAQQLRQYLRV